MSVIDIRVTTTLNGEQAGLIAITAAEGGIGYWSVIDTYKPSTWEYLNVAEDFVFYTLTPDGESDEFEPISVTPRLIAKGIERFLTGVNANFEARPFADPEGFEYMDSDEADIVIQLGAFGEVVYG